MKKNSIVQEAIKKDLEDLYKVQEEVKTECIKIKSS